MHRYRTLIPLVLLSLVLCGFSRGPHPFKMQELVMQDFVKAIQAYHEKHDVYPLDDQDSTWYQKILPETSYYVKDIKASYDGRYPLDYYGGPYIYEPPTQADSSRIVIRSTGENGVDDKGALDDWDIRFGPNYGYWYTMNWPAAKRRAIICSILFLVGLVVIGIKVKKIFAQIIWTSIWLGFLGGHVLSWGFDPYYGSIDPHWIGTVSHYGVLLLLLGLFLGFVRWDFKRFK